ncbi:hypothetical protein GLOTRDRAFT_93896 [Gloeophyllum trabeum ATCC 11539]|uniref:Uncharacterized protein n=1 Tax=Gloeophyllum trabeum (strain ATCC 11539 / FP-39264 / Madison 617) TaxID=670483 RepID=S7Q7K7_GLOTA|nr:uncharacterized protein GLOTRDRAFT_93896 [Gloeophyllum trabeum ATCC 11539]EPQ55458.1 hypothetical protein GLOTRDRAFT_93896 [Gloeophyllum trabeum ATCC 11539]
MALSTGERGKIVAAVMEERSLRAIHFMLATNDVPGSADRSAAQRFFEALCLPGERFEAHMMDTMRSYAMLRITGLAEQVAKSAKKFVGGGFTELLEKYSWGRHEDELPGFEIMRKKLQDLEGASALECLMIAFRHLHKSTSEFCESADKRDGSPPSHSAGQINSMIIFAHYLSRAPVFSALIDHPACQGITLFLGSFRYKLAMLGRYYGCLERLKALVRYSERKISWEWCSDTDTGIVNHHPVIMKRSYLEVIRTDLPAWMGNPETYFGTECPKYREKMVVSTHPALRLILLAPKTYLKLIGCSDGVCLSTEAWVKEYNVAEKTDWDFGPSLEEADPTFALTHAYAFEEKVYSKVQNLRGISISNVMWPNDRDY